MFRLWNYFFGQNNEDSQSDVNQKESSSTDDEESDDEEGSSSDEEESLDKIQEEVSNTSCVFEGEGDDSYEAYNDFLNIVH